MSLQALFLQWVHSAYRPLALPRRRSDFISFLGSTSTCAACHERSMSNISSITTHDLPLSLFSDLLCANFNGRADWYLLRWATQGQPARYGVTRPQTRSQGKVSISVPLTRPTQARTLRWNMTTSGRMPLKRNLTQTGEITRWELCTFNGTRVRHTHVHLLISPSSPTCISWCVQTFLSDLWFQRHVAGHLKAVTLSWTTQRGSMAPTALRGRRLFLRFTQSSRKACRARSSLSTRLTKRHWRC